MLPYINTPFAYIAQALGASTDELKLIFSFLLSYPLAGVLKRIPDAKPWQKNAFTILVSTFYLVGLFDLWAGVRTLFISSAGAYCIAKYIRSPYMPWIGFVFLMTHMSISHIDRQAQNSPSSVDITGAQMVLVMKLTAFCWNIADGRLPEKDLSDFQKERALKEPPSILDFAGYVLFFPALLVGPAFDYADYRNWITTTMFELPKGVDPSKAPPTRKKRKIPRSGRPAALKALYGGLWIFAFLKLSSVYTPETLLDESYMQYGFLRRVWMLHMLSFTARAKYYGVWSLTEGACILSGIGYRGVDPKTGRPAWDKLANINPTAIELAQNSYAYLGNWNMNTNSWLRNYMYLRVTPRGKKPGFRASMATFVTSAFWHGFYPGYYMTFVLASFIQTIAKNGRRYLRPFFLTPDGTKPLPSKRYYDVLTWFVTQTCFAFTTAPFILLTGSASFLVWKRVYFFPVIGIAACFAFLNSPGKAVLVKQLKARKGTTATTSSATSSDKQGLSVPPPLQRVPSHDTVKPPTLGISDDPEAELQEIVAEVKQEIEARRRRGSTVPVNVKKLIEEKIEERHEH